MSSLPQRIDDSSSLTRLELTVRAVEQLAAGAERGEHLGTKRQIQEACGVSKGTFNEALRILQSRGVVTVRPGPNGGLFATQPTPVARLGSALLSAPSASRDVGDAVRIRAALEPLMVADVLEYGSAADFAVMRGALERMHGAVEEQAQDRFVEADWDLHAAIARVSPNVMLRVIGVSLLEVLRSHDVKVEWPEEEPLPEVMVNRLRLHEDLVAAMERGDRERSVDLAAEHGRRSLRYHVQQTQRTGPTALPTTSA